MHLPKISIAVLAFVEDEYLPICTYRPCGNKVEVPPVGLDSEKSTQIIIVPLVAKEILAPAERPLGSKGSNVFANQS
jgi:hypothetical protein